MTDPTYDTERIKLDPIWYLAFRMSEVDNDNAPIGWFKYIHLARYVLDRFEEKKKD